MTFEIARVDPDVPYVPVWTVAGNIARGTGCIIHFCTDGTYEAIDRETFEITARYDSTGRKL
jgi:hypothetical protein